MHSAEQVHPQRFDWAQRERRRKYQLGFIGSAFLFDAAVLWIGFYLAASSFVMKPGILIDLPDISFSGGVSHQASILSISHDGRFFMTMNRLHLNASRRLWLR